MPFSERQIELHKDLISFLYGELEDKVVEQIIKNVSEKDETLSGMKSLSEVIDRWHSQYKMGILDYGILIEALKEVDEIPLVGCIEDKIQEIEKIQEPQRSESTIFCQPPIEMPVRVDGPEHLFYRTAGQKGYLLILNFEENRDYTEKDVGVLKSFFGSELDFDIKSPRDNKDMDFSKEDIDSELKEARVILSSKFIEYYCFICVVLSHGSNKIWFKENRSRSKNEVKYFTYCRTVKRQSLSQHPTSDDAIDTKADMNSTSQCLKVGSITTRNGPYKEETLIQQFVSKNLENFAGKPKIFIFQKCQGSKEMKNIPKPRDQPDDDLVKPEKEKDGGLQQYVPEQADILLIHSNTPGYKSYRREGCGSWLVHNCLEEFRANYRTQHIEEMLITVRDKVSHMRTDKGFVQMPCTWSTLTKRLMLKKAS